MFTLSRSAVCSAVVTSTAILSNVLPASAQLSNVEYQDRENYRFQVLGMPDFDQRRQTLPNRGTCFCGPTAAANVIGTLTANGFPELDPGEPEGTGWHDAENYTTISNYLNSIATGMGINFSAGNGICGTTPWQLADYLRTRYADDFTVRTTWLGWSYGRSDGAREVHTSWLAKLVAIDGALGLMHRRTYAGNWDDLYFDVDRRVGGHILSIPALDATGGQVEVLMHNPWTGASDPNTSQSPIAVQRSAFKHLFIDDNGTIRNTRQIGQPWADPSGSGNVQLNILSGFIAISPKGGFTWSPLDDLELCVDLVQPGIGNWLVDLATIREICLDSTLEPIVTGIEEIRTTPEGSDIAALVDGRIRIISRLDGSTRILPIDEFLGEAISDFVIDETGMLHVAAGKHYGRFDWFAVNLGGEEPLWRTVMPEAVGSIAHDAGVTYCLLPESGVIHRTSEGASGILETMMDLPEGVVLNSESRLRVLGSRLFILTDEAVDTFLVDGDKIFVDTLEMPSGPVTDLSIDDGETLCFVLRDGAGFRCEVRHFDPTGAFVVNADHVLHGTDVSERMVVDRSRVGMPNDPDDLVGPGPEDFLCPGDLDLDGDVDGADLSTLLGSWGAAGDAADIDGDGIIGGSDLSLLLGSWGDCSGG